VSDDTLSGGRCKFRRREYRRVEWWSGGVVEWWSGGVVEWWSGGVWSVECGVLFS
jgi:hypothetical protein